MSEPINIDEAGRTNAHLRTIVLVGFMGAGKTSVGRLLAARLRRSFVDLDAHIEDHTLRSVRAIIDADGEAAFRLLETDALNRVLTTARKRPPVLATGGGTWTLERNRRLIEAHNCYTVWLDAPFDLCRARISTDDRRPLARDPARARALYDERQELYRLAEHRLEVAPTLRRAAIADLLAARFELDNQHDSSDHARFTDDDRKHER